MLGLTAGIWIVGQFASVKQIKKKDLTPVEGLYELTLVEPSSSEYGEDIEFRMKLSQTMRNGDPTRVWGDLKAADPQPGDLLIVRVTIESDVWNNRAQVRYTAKGVMVVEPKKSAAAAAK